MGLTALSAAFSTKLRGRSHRRVGLLSAKKGYLPLLPGFRSRPWVWLYNHREAVPALPSCAWFIRPSSYSVRHDPLNAAFRQPAPPFAQTAPRPSGQSVLGLIFFFSFSVFAEACACLCALADRPGSTSHSFCTHTATTHDDASQQASGIMFVDQANPNS